MLCDLCDHALVQCMEKKNAEIYPGLPERPYFDTD